MLDAVFLQNSCHVFSREQWAKRHFLKTPSAKPPPTVVALLTDGAKPVGSSELRLAGCRVIFISKS